MLICPARSRTSLQFWQNKVRGDALGTLFGRLNKTKSPRLHQCRVSHRASALWHRQICLTPRERYLTAGVLLSSTYWFDKRDKRYNSELMQLWRQMLSWAKKNKRERRKRKRRWDVLPDDKHSDKQREGARLWLGSEKITFIFPAYHSQGV